MTKLYIDKIIYYQRLLDGLSVIKTDRNQQKHLYQSELNWAKIRPSKIL